MNTSNVFALAMASCPPASVGMTPIILTITIAITSKIINVTRRCRCHDSRSGCRGVGERVVCEKSTHKHSSHRSVELSVAVFQCSRVVSPSVWQAMEKSPTRCHQPSLVLTAHAPALAHRTRMWSSTSRTRMLPLHVQPAQRATPASKSSRSRSRSCAAIFVHLRYWCMSSWSCVRSQSGGATTEDVGGCIG